MIRVNMHEAKSQLSKLVDAALNGEEVVICRAGEETVELKPRLKASRQPRIPGALKDKLGPVSDTFYDPWSPKDFGPGVMDDAPEWGSSPEVWDGRTPRKPGGLKGVITLDETFFDPLTDEELGLETEPAPKGKAHRA
jgi:antitoxin (DNA-binding transcriptional repressor) of toxin-antitoxin stability system